MDITAFLLIFMVATIVAVIAKYINWPYTIALVISGLVVGIIGVYVGFKAPVTIDKNLIFHILLPPLLFEGALHMPLKHLRENAKTVSLLAVPGVIFSTILVGFLVNFFIPDIPLIYAMLFAAIIIPTDPASVLAIYKVAKVPQKMRTIVEAESVFDDGIAIVLYNVILVLIVSGNLDIVNGAWEFTKLSVIGVAIGLVFGYVTFLIMRQINDKFTEVMITIILAFGIFAFAEMLGGSGVFAVVIAGLILGNYGTRFAMDPSTRLSLVTFWSFAAFLVNSFLFIIVGMSINIGSIWNNITIVILGVLALWAARAVTISIVGGIVNRKREELPAKWRFLLWWGGLRGAIPIALALSIPLVLANGDPFPHRDTIIAATFGAVLFTLMIQGLTLRPLVKKLGFRTQLQDETDVLDAAMSRDTADELKEMLADGVLSQEGYELLGKSFAAANSQMLCDIGECVQNHDFVPKDEYKKAVRDVLVMKRASVRKAIDDNMISETVGGRLLSKIDAQIASSSVDGVSNPLPAPREIFQNTILRQRKERICGKCNTVIQNDDKSLRCACGTEYHEQCAEGMSCCMACDAKLRH
ncbi:MAG: Na+/H+ antiporter [Methanobacteriota archaeon]